MGVAKMRKNNKKIIGYIILCFVISCPAVFALLKWNDAISWSWWWIFSSWLIGAALVLLVISIGTAVHLRLLKTERTCRQRLCNIRHNNERR
jgi:putative effector of murein hydrolase LrgA (UPF0299 family)